MGAHDQIYDMQEDRGETKNLAAHYPDRCHELRNFLGDFLESCRQSHAGTDYPEEVDMITVFQEPGDWRDGQSAEGRA